MRDRAYIKALARKKGYTIYQDTHHRPPKYRWPTLPIGTKPRTYRYLSIVGALSEEFIDAFTKEFPDARILYNPMIDRYSTWEKIRQRAGKPRRITASLPEEDFE